MSVAGNDELIRTRVQDPTYIASCLRVVSVPADTNSTTHATPITTPPSILWPCLVFPTINYVQAFTTHYGVYNTVEDQMAMVRVYMDSLESSVQQAPVALLLGPRPPTRILAVPPIAGEDRKGDTNNATTNTTTLAVVKVLPFGLSTVLALGKSPSMAAALAETKKWMVPSATCVVPKHARTAAPTADEAASIPDPVTKNPPEVPQSATANVKAPPSLTTLKNVPPAMTDPVETTTTTTATLAPVHAATDVSDPPVPPVDPMDTDDPAQSAAPTQTTSAVASTEALKMGARSLEATATKASASAVTEEEEENAVQPKSTAGATGVWGEDGTESVHAEPLPTQGSTEDVKNNQGKDESVEETVDEALVCETPSRRRSPRMVKKAKASSKRKSASKRASNVSREKVASSQKKTKKTASSSPSSSSKSPKRIGPMMDPDFTSFEEVKPLLIKGGYKIGPGHRYCRPSSKKCTPKNDSVVTFHSPEELRQDLCLRGVNCHCGSRADEREACACWTVDEKWKVNCWVRYHVVTSPRADEEAALPPSKRNQVALIPNRAATELLLQLGFQYSCNLFSGYILPHVDVRRDVPLDGVNGFLKDIDMWEFLCRNGLPDDCEFDQITEDERFHLEFFIAANQTVNTFDYTKSASNPSPDGSRSSRRRHSSMTSTIDDGSTVVSLESRTETALASRDATVYTNDSVASIHEPSRVSMSPEISLPESSTLPEFQGPDRDRLQETLEALHNSSEITTGDPDKSEFSKNISKMAHFLDQVIEGNGSHGDSSTGNGAALYVCGPPGIGKTSGVKWCCDKVSSSWTSDSDAAQPIVCYINAACLVSDRTPLYEVYEVVAEALGIKGKSENSVLRSLKCRNSDEPKEKTLILVCDEIDCLVGSPNKQAVLTKLLSWANDTMVQMALIGISNSINDDKVDRIGELGLFDQTLIFRAYNSYELRCILETKVGHSVVNPAVLEYIAKTVAGSSGDLRVAIETLSNTLIHRLKTANNKSMTTGPLVSIPNVLMGNKSDTIKTKLAGLPLVGKTILCVVNSLARAGAIETTLGKFKRIVNDALTNSGNENEIMDLADFVVMFETLIDTDLVRATDGFGSNWHYINGSSLGDAYNQPIYVGTQLQEVDKAIETELNQGFFQEIRKGARLYYTSEN